MSRSKKPRFRGHTPRSTKLDAIVVASLSLVFVVLCWLVVSDALSSGSFETRDGTTYRLSDDPIAFVAGIGLMILVLAVFAVGAFAKLRNIGWRNWRH